MSGLFGSTILEVVIGLAFVYILLSLLCSSINELIAGYLKLRARDLESAILNLLNDEGTTNEVLNHPLIKVLRKTGAATSGEASATSGEAAATLRNLWATRQAFDGKPSYIPSRTFSIALFDTITPPTGRPITVGNLQSRAAELGGLNLDAPASASESIPVANLTPQQSLGRALLSLINESLDRGQLRLSLDGARDRVNRVSDPSIDDAARQTITAAGTFAELRRRIEALPASGGRTWLLETIEGGQTELEQARRSVERWFDDAMERASGVYKRRTQRWLLVIAAGVTLFLGVDTFRLYNSLATNPGLRAALVTQAEQATGAGGILAQPTPTVAAGTGTPTADTTEATTENMPAPTANELLDELDRTNLPFGYADAPFFTAENESLGEVARWSIAKVVGLLVSIFAVALGAPFWFDVLNRVSNLRASGKPPASTSAATPPPSRSSS